MAIRCAAWGNSCLGCCLQPTWAATPWTRVGKLWLAQHLFSIKGDLHYDKVLIDAADLAVEGKGDGRISQDDAELIWRMVESDGKITDLERRTLAYMVEHYTVTAPAKAFLEGKLSG